MNLKQRSKEMLGFGGLRRIVSWSVSLMSYRRLTHPTQNGTEIRGNQAA
ncbi:MAG: hypothetical protein AB4426_26450 [Xenococcaceae cyanobacterium]